MEPSYSTSAPDSHGAPPPPRSRAGLIGGVGAAALVLLAKAKGLLVLLKGLKLGKLLLTMGSMFAMIWFEAVRFGWIFGLGFVVLILIHELGHGVAIKRAGLDAGYPVFIPFLGAFISLKGQLRSPLVESNIALAGPIAGAAASAGCAGLYFATGGRLWLALAHSGFFLNLFNMTPISPLDGGRAARVFSRTAWIIGLVLLAGLFVFTSAPQILLIGILALTHTFSTGRATVSTTADDIAALPPEARRNVAFNYFGLCIFLALGTYLTSTLLSRPSS